MRRCVFVAKQRTAVQCLGYGEVAARWRAATLACLQDKTRLCLLLLLLLLLPCRAPTIIPFATKRVVAMFTELFCSVLPLLFCRSAASSCTHACTSCNWTALNWTQQQLHYSLTLLLLAQPLQTRARLLLLMLMLMLMLMLVHCSSALPHAHPMQRLTSSQQVGSWQDSGGLYSTMHHLVISRLDAVLCVACLWRA
jgi:hypothetical protein